MAGLFTDRIPTKPNRYLVTPETGDPYYVTLERADEPTNVGTPLNANTLNRLAEKGHTHTTDDIVAGILPIIQGGTGATDVETARKNLKAAPSGLGIGAVAWYDKDIDEITKTGVYAYTSSNTSPNKPCTLGTLVHLEQGGSANIATQIAIDGNYPFPRVLIRKRGSGGWSNWANDNVLGYEGVEYLTTERYKGAPVYCKVLTYTPSATIDGTDGTTVTIAHKISGFGELVRCDATISGDTELKQYFHLPYTNQNGGTTSVMRVDGTNITVGVYKMMWLVNNTFSVKLYYTKV